MAKDGDQETVPTIRSICGLMFHLINYYILIVEELIFLYL